MSVDSSTIYNKTDVIDSPDILRRIIVIDDNIEIQEDFKKVFESPATKVDDEFDDLESSLFGDADQIGQTQNKFKYEVAYASQGEEGFRKIVEAHEENNPFHLAFVDMRMPPGWDGLETIRHIWNFDENIQIVICTAYSDHSWKEITEELGVSDGLLILKKPFDSIEVAQIASALTQKWYMTSQATVKLEQLESMVIKQTEQLSLLLDEKVDKLDQVSSGQQQLMGDVHGFEGLKIAAVYKPTAEAGGDFYDIIKFSDQSYGFLVADVSGHDLAVSYITGALKALTAIFTGDGQSTIDTTIMFNKALCAFLPEDKYVTMCYAKYDKETRILEVVNAAHPNVLVVPSEGDAYYMTLKGSVMGMYDMVSCENLGIEVNSGDRIYMYTDGIIEGYPDKKGVIGSRAVGMEMFMKHVTRRRNDPVEDVVNSVVVEVEQYNGGAIDDDVIMLGVEF